MRTVKGHQQTVMILKVEPCAKACSPHAGRPEAKMSLMPDSCAASSSPARTRANHFLVVGERTVDIHRDGFDCHMCLLASFLSRTILYPSRGTFAQRAYDGCKTTPFETKAKVLAKTCSDIC